MPIDIHTLLELVIRLSLCFENPKYPQTSLFPSRSGSRFLSLRRSAIFTGCMHAGLTQTAHALAKLWPASHARWRARCHDIHRVVTIY